MHALLLQRVLHHLGTLGPAVGLMGKYHGNVLLPVIAAAARSEQRTQAKQGKSYPYCKLLHHPALLKS